MCDFNPIEEFVNIVEGELSKPDVKYFIEGLSPEVSDEPFGDSIPALRKVGRRYSASVFLALMTMVRYEACVSLLELIVENDLDVEHEWLLNAEPTGKDGYPGSWPCEVEYDEAKGGAAGLIWHRIINADLNRAWLEEKLREYEAKGKTFKEVSTALQKVLKYKKLDDVYAAIRFQKYEACFCAVEIVEEAREDKVDLKEVLEALKKHEVTWVRKERKIKIIKPKEILLDLGACRDVQFSANNLLKYFGDGHCLVDIETMETKPIDIPETIRTLVFSPCGRFFYYWKEENKQFLVYRYAIETGQQESILVHDLKLWQHFHFPLVLRDRFIALRASLCYDRLFCIDSGEFLQIPEEISKDVATILMSPKEDKLALACYGEDSDYQLPELLYLWDWQNRGGAIKVDLDGPSDALGVRAENDKWYVVCVKEHCIYYVDFESGDKFLKSRLVDVEWSGISHALSNSGKLFALSYEKEVRIFETKKGSVVASLPAYIAGPISFSSDDKYLAVGGCGGFVVELAKYLP